MWLDMIYWQTKSDVSCFSSKFQDNVNIFPTQFLIFWWFYIILEISLQGHTVWHLPHSEKITNCSASCLANRFNYIKKECSQTVDVLHQSIQGKHCNFAWGWWKCCRVQPQYAAVLQQTDWSVHLTSQQIRLKDTSIFAI